MLGDSPRSDALRCVCRADDVGFCLPSPLGEGTTFSTVNDLMPLYRETASYGSQTFHRKLGELLRLNFFCTFIPTSQQTRSTQSQIPGTFYVKGSTSYTFTVRYHFYEGVTIAISA